MAGTTKRAASSEADMPIASITPILAVPGWFEKASVPKLQIVVSVLKSIARAVEDAINTLCGPVADNA